MSGGVCIFEININKLKFKENEKNIDFDALCFYIAWLRKG